MASKYAHLRGKIPVERTERSVNLTAAINERKQKPLKDWTAEYNRRKSHAEKLTRLAAANKLRMDALEILIRDKIEGDESDAVKSNGYTWTPNVEPYPVASDIDQIVKYFEKHEPDKLKLSATELAGRLKSIIKEEAVENTFRVEEVDVVDEATGEIKKKQVVWSGKVPGVKIFLKPDLSRVKSSKGE